MSNCRFRPDLLRIRPKPAVGHPSRNLGWKCLLYCKGVLEPLYLCPNGARCAIWFQDPTRVTGTMDAFVKIVRHEGTRTLWSGLPATLVMTASNRHLLHGL
ncbi:Solute carrier family 25 member 39 [Myotis brandtii]|uniref:Mitochondrial glutathione transporter SLC25A39 n=1 Tax=Myotis brandtii TaxID=109478 RepID=S7QAI4_MYOBR|nr:Solute carrier family 25 member 39 [Myotis brandtii]